MHAASKRMEKQMRKVISSVTGFSGMEIGSACAEKLQKSIAAKKTIRRK
jgi:hypothetical protein